MVYGGQVGDRLKKTIRQQCVRWKISGVLTPEINVLKKITD